MEEGLERWPRSGVEGPKMGSGSKVLLEEGRWKLKGVDIFFFFFV